MGKKRYSNYRLVKIHRSYTVEDMVDLFGVHPNTVRHWIRCGLAMIDDRRPSLVLGRELADFLKAFRNRNKQPSEPGKIFCVRCKAHHPPAGNLVECQLVTEKIGHLVAICPVCQSILNRRVSLSKVDEVCKGLEVSFVQSQEQLNESQSPIIKCD